MTSDFDPSELQLDLEGLIEDAVTRALQVQDPERFLAWLREHVHDYARWPAAGPQRELFDSEESAGESGLRSLAVILGRQLWNAIPLPGNDFRPLPLAEPGRNDPCFCGSGLKYKQCCARFPRMPGLSAQDLWPIVLPHLDAADRERAIARKRIPVETLAAHAMDHLEQGRPRKGQMLLEPLFGEHLAGTNNAYEFAFDSLCNVYDELGYTRKKEKLIQRVLEQAPRSPLRCGAWQRLAAMRMDAQDCEGAWDAFRQAQRDDPGALALGILEIQLLLAEGRAAEAQERARMWLRKAHREGADESGAADFFAAVAQDPHTAMVELGVEMAEGAGAGLRELIEAMLDRPLPRYRVVSLDEGTGLAEEETGPLLARLRDMGVPERELQELAAGLAIELESLGGFATGEGAPKAGQALDCRGLEAPPEVEDLEEGWHDVFPLDKPFSVEDLPLASRDPWAPESEGEWMGWLRDNPGALDSLDVLDDLATALAMHPQARIAGWDQRMLEPVLTRACGILEQAVASEPGVRLEWHWEENRPALRSLERRMGVNLRHGAEDRALALAERLLELNPGDNHGVRALVMNARLRAGKDGRALELAERYDEDIHAEVLYGRALALFRQGREEEGREWLCTAIDELPKVAGALLAKSLKKPKIDPSSVAIGGDDQAWLYREEMLDVWTDSPGALAWLRRVRKLC